MVETDKFPYRHREPTSRPSASLLCLTIRDLRRNPSYAAAMIARSAPYRTQVPSDHGETKVCDPHTTGGVSEDIWLVKCQCAPLRSPRIMLQEWS